MKLPKFYNPFKPHIVQFADGKFAVRRWSIIDWKYKATYYFFGNDVIYWWNAMEYVKKWCMVDTYEEAAILRDKKRIKPNKVVKFTHEI